MIEINTISDASIAIAITRLRAGDLVAFPTETVYGLGADATNASAVAKIFVAKQRPEFNPLISHVASVNAAFELGEKGTKTKGTITNFYGKVNIKKELSSSTFEVYIPVNNLSTNNDARDKELMSEDWLNSSKYPKMTYSSKNLVQTKDGYELKGTFNMLGVSQKVPVFIKLSSIDKESSSIGPILSGKSSINRMNHGMEQDGEGDVVDFVFKIQLKPITDSP